MLPGFGLDRGSPATYGYGGTINVLVVLLPPNTLDISQASAVMVEMSIKDAVALGIDLAAPVILLTITAPGDLIGQTGVTAKVVQSADDDTATTDGITA